MHLGVVVDEEDASRRRVVASASAALSRGRGSAHRQDDGERGARTRAALDPHLAAVPLHDRVGDRQAEARAFLALGGEEGIEDAPAHVLGHADAGVGDREDDVAVILRAGADAQRPAPRHRVDGVQDQVGEDLVELGRASHDRGYRSEVELEVQGEAARGSSSPPSAGA